MDIMITLGDAVLLFVAIALVILIIYCVFLIKNLITTVKSVNIILEDTQKISAAAADGVEEAQKAIGNIGKSVSAISSALEGNEGLVQGLTSLFKALGSLIGVLKSKKD